MNVAWITIRYKTCAEVGQSWVRDAEYIKMSCEVRTGLSENTAYDISWALTQLTLSQINLSILCTDLHYIASGQIYIHHLCSLSLFFLPHINPIPLQVIFNFEKHSYSSLSQFGTAAFSLSASGSSFVFTPFPLSSPCLQYYLTQDLPLLTDWFLYLPYFICFLSHPNPSLLLTWTECQHIAKSSITALATQSTAFPNITPPLSFATDPSTISHNPTPIKSTTFAVIANSNVFTALLPPNPSTGIVHDEAYPIVVASVLTHQCSGHPTIYSDCLNSICTLSANPTSLTLRNNPACSLYWWIMNIWQSLPFQLTLSHVHAHTNSQAIPSQLNHLADQLATRSNSLSLPLPSLPFPTLFMDTYIPFSFSHGYIELNIFSFTNSQLSTIDSTNLDTFHKPVP